MCKTTQLNEVDMPIGRKIIILCIGAGAIALALIIHNRMESSSSQIMHNSRGRGGGLSIREEFEPTLSTYRPQLRITGRLTASDSIELIPSQTGRLMRGARPFRAGNHFNRGEIIFRISPMGAYSDLYSRRSALLTQVLRMLPELKIANRDSGEEWERYIESFNPESPLRPLPEPKDSRERALIASRDIYTTYYSIKSMEERLSELVVRAPFSGILTSTSIQEGTLVSSGRSIGTFKSSNSFEAKLALPATELRNINSGDSIFIRVHETGEEATTTISRVVPTISSSSQTVPIVANLNIGFDGAFAEAKIFGAPIEQTVSIPHRFIGSESTVKVKKGNSYEIIPVQIISRQDNAVIVKGLTETMRLIR